MGLKPDAVLDEAARAAYLGARMKRLIALFALILGMTTLVAPVQARAADSNMCSELAGVHCAPSARTDRYGEAEAEEPATRGSSGDKHREQPERYRTIILPTVMVADRPLE